MRATNAPHPVKTPTRPANRGGLEEVFSIGAEVFWGLANLEGVMVASESRESATLFNRVATNGAISCLLCPLDGSSCRPLPVIEGRIAVTIVALQLCQCLLLLI